MRKYMVLAIGLFILVAVNVSIWHKEQLITHGKTVFLALAPVDPRSLMQGDYMALRFQLEQDIAPQLKNDKTQNADGYAVVNINAQGIGEFLQLQDNLPSTLNAQQLACVIASAKEKLNLRLMRFFLKKARANCMPKHVMVSLEWQTMANYYYTI
jgi:hypothetical protein